MVGETRLIALTTPARRDAAGNAPKETRVNRSGCGYDACDEDEADEWHRRLRDAIASPKGQAFLRELADALDALPDKVLIEEALIDRYGDCCAIGAVCKARGIDVGEYDNDTDCVAEELDVPRILVAEAVYLNDGYRDEIPVARWQRVRKWVEKQIRKDDVK